MICFKAAFTAEAIISETKWRLKARMSSKGVRSPSTQPSLARESPMGGLPAMEDEEDFFKFSSDECR